MSATFERPPLFSLNPREFLADWYHWLMAVYYIARLGLNRGDTAPTYKYCWHLDQVSFFRKQFRNYLDADPDRVRRWKERRAFVDYIPEPAEFAGYPEGSVGRAYHNMCAGHGLEGLLDLRARRFEVLPDERKGLDLEALDRVEGEELFERIISRRNIFMTSTHDFCHLITGSDTLIAGEALVGRYQYRHLLVPQNWLNMFLSMLVQLLTGRLYAIRRIWECYPVIDSSANYSEIRIDDCWDRPLADVRRAFGLPVDGFMPEGGFAR